MGILKSIFGDIPHIKVPYLEDNDGTFCQAMLVDRLSWLFREYKENIILGAIEELKNGRVTHYHLKELQVLAKHGSLPPVIAKVDGYPPERAIYFYANKAVVLDITEAENSGSIRAYEAFVELLLAKKNSRALSKILLPTEWVKEDYPFFKSRYSQEYKEYSSMVDSLMAGFSSVVFDAIVLGEGYKKTNEALLDVSAWFRKSNVKFAKGVGREPTGGKEVKDYAEMMGVIAYIKKHFFKLYKKYIARTAAQKYVVSIVDIMTPKELLFDKRLLNRLLRVPKEENKGLNARLDKYLKPLLLELEGELPNGQS